MGNTPSIPSPSVSWAHSPPVRQREMEQQLLTSFSISEVALSQDTRCHSAMVVNATYITSLSVDRLLYSFRVYAGIDTKGAQPYGGWEAPGFGFRGHFVGHVLGAYAQMSTALLTSRPDLAQKCLMAATTLVAGLSEVQDAIHIKYLASLPHSTVVSSTAPFGYLNAQSSAQFDRLEALQSCDVPYYVIHKIMSGLLLAYRYCNDPTALTVASAMGDYFAWRMSRLDQETIEQILNTRRWEGQTPVYYMEHGGMLDVAIDLFRATGKKEHLQLAQTFDRSWFLTMLSSGDDQLGCNGEHSNTELPVVVGLANMYMLTKAVTYRNAVLNFLGWMRAGHEFITGGVSGKSAYPTPLDYNSELFNSALLLDRQINSTPGHQGQGSGESCCAHNLQKSTKYGFAWTGDNFWADAFERRFVDSVLAQQHPTTGQFIYNLNLKQGAVKGFGTPEDCFWCCYGTGVEAFSSLTDGMAYHNGTDALWLVNYISAVINWKALALSLTVTSTFPDPSPIAVTFRLKRPTELTVNLNVPSWAIGSNELLLNGKPITGVSTAPGTFAVISRMWADGDVLMLTLPYSVYFETIPDRLEYVGVRYGPRTLVACGPPGAKYIGSASQLLASLRPTKSMCTFVTTLQGPIRDQQVTFKPIDTVTDESYNGYTIVSDPAVAHVLDAVLIADASSETSHMFQSSNSSTGLYKSLLYRDATNSGFVSYTMRVDAAKQNYLRCLYSGDDTSDNTFSRVFDIQAMKADNTVVTFATQSLDREAPNDWYKVVYPIPRVLTNSVERLVIRFQAKGFNNLPGILGGLFDEVQIFTVAQPAQSELWVAV